MTRHYRRDGRDKYIKMLTGEDQLDGAGVLRHFAAVDAAAAVPDVLVQQV